MGWNVIPSLDRRSSATDVPPLPMCIGILPLLEAELRRSSLVVAGYAGSSLGS
jgi:hypothetical protein